MIEAVSRQKLRGAYYTPTEIVDFLTDWAIQSKNDVVLEQCFGDGNFLVASIDKLLKLGASQRNATNRLYGSELDINEFKRAKQRVNQFLEKSTELPNLHEGDFFKHYSEFYINHKFNAVVGNPPFIRYQNFKEEHRARALDIMKMAGLKPNKLTNSWVPFLLSSSLLLKDGGRIGMVIPAEIMQVNYAAELRMFLSNFFGSITLITFETIVFPGIQQEVVLFLGEKTEKKYGIDVIYLSNEKCLKDYAHKLPSKETYKPIDHTHDKWTQYYLTKEEILFLRKLKKDIRLTRLGELAEVDVGIVTGRNEFFVVSKNQIEEYGLHDYTTPLVGRTMQIPGLIFSKNDWNKNNREGLKTNLFSLSKAISEGIPNQVKRYIEEGEEQGYHEGYKCLIRKLWYSVPSVWISDAFLFRQIYDAPKLILNQAQTLTTDTIHRVRFKDKKNSNKIAVCFHNSLTFAFSEIMGRSYGGGVLELEPNEAEHLPIPFFDIDRNTIEELDQLYRKEKDVIKVLDKVDQELLIKHMNLTEFEVKRLRGIWLKLSNRRRNRK